jgi:hypothetical protein
MATFGNPKTSGDEAVQDHDDMVSSLQEPPIADDSDSDRETDDEMKSSTNKNGYFRARRQP